jgi:hypothetical protein
MEGSSCNRAAGRTVIIPKRANSGMPETPVCWSDPPELVLQRLRALRGKEWWR